MTSSLPGIKDSDVTGFSLKVNLSLPAIGRADRDSSRDIGIKVGIVRIAFFLFGIAALTRLLWLTNSNLLLFGGLSSLSRYFVLFDPFSFKLGRRRLFPCRCPLRFDDWLLGLDDKLGLFRWRQILNGLDCLFPSYV